MRVAKRASVNATPSELLGFAVRSTRVPSEFLRETAAEITPCRKNGLQLYTTLHESRLMKLIAGAKGRVRAIRTRLALFYYGFIHIARFMQPLMIQSHF